MFLTTISHITPPVQKPRFSGLELRWYPDFPKMPAQKDKAFRRVVTQVRQGALVQPPRGNKTLSAASFLDLNRWMDTVVRLPNRYGSHPTQELKSRRLHRLAMDLVFSAPLLDRDLRWPTHSDNPVTLVGDGRLILRKGETLGDGIFRVTCFPKGGEPIRIDMNGIRALPGIERKYQAEHQQSVDRGVEMPFWQQARLEQRVADTLAHPGVRSELANQHRLIDTLRQLHPDLNPRDLIAAFPKLPVEVVQ